MGSACTIEIVASAVSRCRRSLTFGGRRAGGAILHFVKNRGRFAAWSLPFNAFATPGCWTAGSSQRPHKSNGWVTAARLGNLSRQIS